MQVEGGAMTRVGVALSGGGHRASVWAAGLLLYLADAGRNGDVGTIASVSGGSITNGVPSGTRVRVPGGGTIVFDQFGRAKYHHRRTSATSGGSSGGSATWSATACPTTTAWSRPCASARRCPRPWTCSRGHHVELAAPAFGDAPFTVVSSG